MLPLCFEKFCFEIKDRRALQADLLPGKSRQQRFKECKLVLERCNSHGEWNDFDIDARRFFLERRSPGVMVFTLLLPGRTLFCVIDSIFVHHRDVRATTRRWLMPTQITNRTWNCLHPLRERIRGQVHGSEFDVHVTAERNPVHELAQILRLASLTKHRQLGEPILLLRSICGRRTDLQPTTKNDFPHSQLESGSDGSNRKVDGGAVPLDRAVEVCNGHEREDL